MPRWHFSCAACHSKVSQRLLASTTVNSSQGTFTYRDANVDGQTADALFQIFDVADEEVERAAAGDRPQAVNTAYCTQWWMCPF